MLSSDFKLLGTKALITGASAGIGEEFARQLHAAGCSLMLCARREQRLRDLCQNFNQLRAGSAEYLCVDLALADSAPAQELRKWLAANALDLLVLNAGRGSFGEFEQIPEQSELEMLQLNVGSTLWLAHAAIPGMKQRQRGALISLSSVAGLQPVPYMSTYAATKAFNLWHALGLREELRPFGIRVLAVCPGPVETEFAGVAKIKGAYSIVHRDSAQAVVAQSLQALHADAGMLVPCMRAKLLSLGPRWLPRLLCTRLVGNSMRKVLHKARSLQLLT
jgi:short-subunit dehydrogenase